MFRYPEVCARYPRYVQSLLGVRRNLRRNRVKIDSFRPWQEDVERVLEGSPDPRLVHWFVDRNGSKGKSYYASHCRDQRNAFVITGGRFQDIYYAFKSKLDGGCGIIIFDWARGSEESFPYRVVEAFKNGFFLSTKYESEEIIFPTPHVLIFANFAPDETQLSADRWSIKEI